MGSASRSDAPGAAPTRAEPRRVGVVTSSRADWAHLEVMLERLAREPGLRIELYVTGAHLAPTFGRTLEVIRDSGFRGEVETIDCLLDGDSASAVAVTLGLATLRFADLLARRRPDLLLVIADRSEMLAPAVTALPLRIPVVHIEGGELSEGAIDQQVRTALTALAHVHLVTTDAARRRLLAMGEAPWRVHRVGAGSLDRVASLRRVDRASLEARIGIRLASPLIVGAVHPVTIDEDPAAEARPFLAALDVVARKGATVVLCHPNADESNRAIRDAIDRFVAVDPVHRAIVVNLPPDHYWSLLGMADAMAGNSSSVVMESPTLRLPAVCVGRRQQGRERAANVIDAPADRAAIGAALRRALDPAFRTSLDGLVNPYGDGCAADRIAQILSSLPPAPVLLEKRGIPDAQLPPAVPVPPRAAAGEAAGHGSRDHAASSASRSSNPT
ncbi:MAG: UDP-N-acetylglucosamine 2-epimerase (hydrolyzing) [Phycisphaeraceae bacterium]|nr:UDP-N-acetylglucosamine 2-epimerase (hydrolyzing) [Phycisphaeraceae bacterium]